MDIHKPKAAHSWREFLVEIGTIICGILIALALEQAVEAGRIRREVSEAREALHAEMSRNLTVANNWLKAQPCWLRAAEAAGAWADGTGPRPRFPSGIMSGYQTTVWEMTRAGPVTHMPLKERLALASFYGSITNEHTVVERQREFVTEAGGYLNRTKLSAQEAGELARLAGQIGWVARVEALNDRGLLDDGARLGLKATSPDPGSEARIEAFCRSFPSGG